MLQAKFKVGQKVYGVSNRSNLRQIHVKCDVCESTGKVKVNGKDEEYTCPVCQGRIEIKHYGYIYVISYFNAKIGRVQITEYDEKYKKDNKSEVTYMLDKTGVGSGQIWHEDRLFATEKEAQDFCNRYIPSDYYDREAILKEEYRSIEC